MDRRQDEEASPANDITHSQAGNDRFQDYASNRIITGLGRERPIALRQTNGGLPAWPSPDLPFCYRPISPQSERPISASAGGKPTGRNPPNPAGHG